jgi:cob(I)alamin adenosyltransferase
VKIYTRTGDSGETSLFDGSRVPKSEARVSTYGDVDELNAFLGLARASVDDQQLAAMLERIQRDLFALGSRLADPSHRIAERVTKAAVTGEDIARLESWIDTLENELQPLRRFILPGGVAAGACLHVARTVCRRAERHTIALSREEAVGPQVIPYLNRLSDLLFVASRYQARLAGKGDLLWDSRGY